MTKCDAWYKVGRTKKFKKCHKEAQTLYFINGVRLVVCDACHGRIQCDDDEYRLPPRFYDHVIEHSEKWGHKYG